MSGSITLYFSLLLLGMVCLAISFFQWRWSMYFFFVWLLVEGAFRKWFLPGLATLLIFVKYAVVVGPFILCWLRNKANFSYPFIPIIFFYFFWGFIEFFNWSATNDLRIFLVGMMIHYAFITLIVTVPALLNTKKKILNFFRWCAYLSIPILLLGIYQYSLPPQHYLNKYVGDNSDSVAGYMGKVRIISTFSYIAPFGQYLIILIGVLMVLIVQEKNKLLSIVYYNCFILAWLNVFMTASRGVFAVCVLLTLGFIILSISRHNTLWFKFVQRIFIVGVLTVITFVFSPQGQQSYERLTKRFNKKISVRVYNMIRLARLQNAGLLGYGIGTEFQGIARILDIRKKFDVSFENEKDRLVAGIGLVGYSIVMVMRVVILIWVWGVFFRTRNYSLRVILIFSVACITQGVVLGGVIYNFIANAHYWFSVGLAIAVLRINHAEKMQQWQLRQLQLSQLPQHES